MRKFLAFGLILAFGASTFSKVFVVADYYVNTNAYKQKCENKARPILRCNGKCQMMKKLLEQEKKDQQNSERKFENKNDVFSSRSFYAGINPSLFYTGKPKYTLFTIGRPIDEISYCFHPPAA